MRKKTKEIELMPVLKQNPGEGYELVDLLSRFSGFYIFFSGWSVDSLVG
jgi:hypothetical protein